VFVADVARKGGRCCVPGSYAFVGGCLVFFSFSFCVPPICCSFVSRPTRVVYFSCVFFLLYSLLSILCVSSARRLVDGCWYCVCFSVADGCFFFARARSLSLSLALLPLPLPLALFVSLSLSLDPSLYLGVNYVLFFLVTVLLLASSYSSSSSSSSSSSLVLRALFLVVLCSLSSLFVLLLLFCFVFAMYRFPYSHAYPLLHMHSRMDTHALSLSFALLHHRVCVIRGSTETLLPPPIQTPILFF
jgi:hypothetical protein